MTAMGMEMKERNEGRLEEGIAGYAVGSKHGAFSAGYLRPSLLGRWLPRA
jgi:hypothetical protein